MAQAPAINGALWQHFPDHLIKVPLKKEIFILIFFQKRMIKTVSDIVFYIADKTGRSEADGYRKRNQLIVIPSDGGPHFFLFRSGKAGDLSGDIAPICA